MSFGDRIRRVGQWHGGEEKEDKAELYLYEHVLASDNGVYHDKGYQSRDLGGSPIRRG